MRLAVFTTRYPARPIGHSSGIGESPRTPPRRVGRLLRDTIAIGASAARHGAAPFAKSASVIPKAWAWAARRGERFDHVLADNALSALFHQYPQPIVECSALWHAECNAFR